MSEHTTQPGFETSVADLVEMVKQCTGHPDREEPRTPSHFDLIQQARKAAEVLAEDNAWLHNTLRDRDARIAELEQAVTGAVSERDEFKAGNEAALKLWQDAVRDWNADVQRLRSELAEVKANANTALREACADAGKGGPCSREGCSRPRGPHGWCFSHRCSNVIEDGPDRYRVCEYRCGHAGDWHDDGTTCWPTYAPVEPSRCVAYRLGPNTDGGA